MKTSTSLVTTVLLIAGLVVMGLSASAAPIPALPSINAPDLQPQGCVSCHVKTAAKDFRLTVVLNSLKGGHPDVTKLVKNVPGDCLKCHFASAKAPVLGSMVHRNHFADLVDNDFLSLDKGYCLSCHNIDTKSGKISYKNAPANW